MPEAPPTLPRLRRILLGIWMLGAAGTLTELVLLEHTEDATQLIPAVLLGAGLAAAVWNAVSPGLAARRAFQAVLASCLAAGLLGVYFHYAANIEFQRELEPGLAGAALLWKALQAKSPPALAPGVMVQLGLLGFAYTFRNKGE